MDRTPTLASIAGDPTADMQTPPTAGPRGRRPMECGRHIEMPPGQSRGVIAGRAVHAGIGAGTRSARDA